MQTSLGYILDDTVFSYSDSKNGDEVRCERRQWWDHRWSLVGPLSLKVREYAPGWALLIFWSFYLWNSRPLTAQISVEFTRLHMQINKLLTYFLDTPAGRVPKFSSGFTVDCFFRSRLLWRKASRFTRYDFFNQFIGKLRRFVHRLGTSVPAQSKTEQRLDIWTRPSMIGNFRGREVLQKYGILLCTLLK